MGMCCLAVSISSVRLIMLNDNGIASILREASEEAIRNIVRNWKPNTDRQNP